jgi:hypothetical protein
MGEWEKGVAALCADFNQEYNDALVKYQELNHSVGVGLTAVRCGDRGLQNGELSPAIEQYEFGLDTFSENADLDWGWG